MAYIVVIQLPVQLEILLLVYNQLTTMHGELLERRASTSGTRGRTRNYLSASSSGLIAQLPRSGNVARRRCHCGGAPSAPNFASHAYHELIHTSTVGASTAAYLLKPTKLLSASQNVVRIASARSLHQAQGTLQSRF